MHYSHLGDWGGHTWTLKYNHVARLHGRARNKRPHDPLPQFTVQLPDLAELHFVAPSQCIEVKEYCLLFCPPVVRGPDVVLGAVRGRLGVLWVFWNIWQNRLRSARRTWWGH